MNIFKKPFTMPEQLEEVVSEKKYGKFVIEPLEKTFGHTLGNSLRRVLLSSLESIAISWVKIDGVDHEFGTLDGVVEDVSDIILNFKKIRIKGEFESIPNLLEINIKKRQGVVLAKDIDDKGIFEIANPEQYICTLDKEQDFRVEISLDYGRGYKDSSENKPKESPIGLIPVDSLFSPVERVSYDVINTRVGRVTDYEKLVLEIWTDGRISAKEAFEMSCQIIIKHFNIFISTNAERDNINDLISTPEDEMLLHKLMMHINSLNLSVRSLNCLNDANINYVGELVQRNEGEMLEFRNFGRKSLNEIKDKLKDLGLTINVKIKDEIRLALSKSLNKLYEEQKK